MKPPIPAALLGSHIGIVGKAGSGKSNTAKVIVEYLLAMGERVIIIDPTGTWYGLRLPASGKGASPYPIAIFGGEHADLPISESHGGAIGEAVATSASSVIIDLRAMRISERTRFFTDFAETLLRRNVGKLHLVIDEAHLFAPQGKVNDRESGAMLRAANDLVALGRGNGLAITLISQRPAKVHKDSLTQVETLIALRLIAPQDTGAVAEWTKAVAGSERLGEIMSSLPTLRAGEAWVYSPEAEILERTRFPLASTYDSGHQRAAEGVKIKPIDMTALRGKLDAVEADAKANDPRALRAEIARLQATVRGMEGTPMPTFPDPKLLDQTRAQGYADGWRAGAASGVKNAAAHAQRWAEEAQREASKAVGAAVAQIAAMSVELIVAQSVGPNPALAPPRAPAQKPQPPVSPSSNGRTPDFGSGNRGSNPRGEAKADKIGAERKPLGVLASTYPGGMTEAQWATLAGFKRTGGTWGAYKGRLRNALLVEQRGQLWFATQYGLAAIGDDVEPPPPPGQARVDFWAGKISGVAPMLAALARGWPHWIDRSTLASTLNMAASGGTFGAYISRLSSNGLIEKRGSEIRIARMLMEGP